MKLLEEAGHRTTPLIAHKISHKDEPLVGPDTAAILPASDPQPPRPVDLP